MKTSESLRSRAFAGQPSATASPNSGDCSSPVIRPESAASYIADITTELAELARGCKLEILAYLLDIAQLEAAESAKRLARESCAR